MIGTILPVAGRPAALGVRMKTGSPRRWMGREHLPDRLLYRDEAYFQGVHHQQDQEEEGPTMTAPPPEHAPEQPLVPCKVLSSSLLSLTTPLVGIVLEMHRDLSRSAKGASWRTV
jgi:hypothetical protein